MVKKLTITEKNRRAKESEVMKALGPGEKRKAIAAAKRKNVEAKRKNAAVKRQIKEAIKEEKKIQVQLKKFASKMKNKTLKEIDPALLKDFRKRERNALKGYTYEGNVFNPGLHHGNRRKFPIQGVVKLDDAGILLDACSPQTNKLIQRIRIELGEHGLLGPPTTGVQIPLHMSVAEYLLDGWSHFTSTSSQLCWNTKAINIHILFKGKTFIVYFWQKL